MKASDEAAVQRFNSEAEAYTTQTKAHKALGAELALARNELSELLNDRARLRPADSAAAAQNVTPPRDPKTERPSAPAPGNGKRVVMYTKANCPAVAAAKTYLAHKGIRYEERDVERSSDARKEFRKLGGRGLPLILVDDARMEGFNPRWLDSAIGG